MAFVQFENAPLWPFSPGVSVCVIGYAERFPDDKAPPGQPCFVSVVVITCASHAQGRRFEPGTKQYFCARLPEPWPALRPATTHALNLAACHSGFYGVMVSTLDFESSDPSSNLGRTSTDLTPWRNGSASDSRSEGCVFESRRGQNFLPRLGHRRQNSWTASNED